MTRLQRKPFFSLGVCALPCVCRNEMKGACLFNLKPIKGYKWRLYFDLIKTLCSSTESIGW